MTEVFEMRLYAIKHPKSGRWLKSVSDNNMYEWTDDFAEAKHFISTTDVREYAMKVFGQAGQFNVKLMSVPVTASVQVISYVR